MMMVMERKTKPGGPGTSSIAAAAVLAERPAGVPKTVSVECINRILLGIERAKRNSLFRDEMPGLMEKLCGKMGDLEALMASSAPNSEAGKAARYGLEIIRGNGPAELKGQG